MSEKKGMILLKVQGLLNKSGVFLRRYFYPSLNTLYYVHKVGMPISESIASRVMCLPLYYGLNDKEAIKFSNVSNYKNLV